MLEHRAKLAELPNPNASKWAAAQAVRKLGRQQQLAGSHNQGVTMRGRPWQPAPADFSTAPPVPPRRNDPIDWEGVGSGEQED